ncbi:c-type cytochrome [Micromonospora chersina]|uniref:cytochrome bc1 complex diheme cytochrome c subunit n=1 Tax=Micromonospora chersina TaxID=47854 RepID=UPI0036765363
MRLPRAVTLPALYPRRALVVGSVLALAVGPVALAPAPDPTPTPAATTPAGDRGTRLYLEQCASCHGVRGQGSQQGPSLVGVGPAAVDFQLSTGRMPVSREVSQARRREPVFSADDISALVDHVAGFGDGGPEIPRVAPGDVASGRAVFAANCAPCHGATGSGAVLTNGWSAPPLYDASATQIAEAVRVGPGLMPAFPGQVLTDQQVDDLTSYVRRLRTERLDPGGNPLGRLGPLAEGLLAWVAVLVLLVAGVRWLGRRAAE